jgi:hypothetical protein
VSTARPTTRIKRIDPNAYSALAEALPVIYWNKKPWTRFVRSVLRDVPEILVGLDFDNDTKRETAGLIVERFMADEERYQAVAISLMLTISRMHSFPNLESQVDREDKIAIAKAAVAELRKWTDRHQSIADKHERYAAEIAKAVEEAARNRAFSESLARLKGKFLAMGQGTDPHARGIEFEGFLNELFRLFDLEPRAAYSMEGEQVDGAFSFDTDDYILEAKWWQRPVGRGQLDIFCKRIEKKGKDALGLYISINGFTQDARDEYSAATPFITMEAADLLAVLEERIGLVRLLRQKKRHMNETGECYFPVWLVL